MPSHRILCEDEHKNRVWRWRVNHPRRDEVDREEQRVIMRQSELEDVPLARVNGQVRNPAGVDERLRREPGKLPIVETHLAQRAILRVRRPGRVGIRDAAL